MTPQQCFGIVVRTVGLLLTIFSLHWFVTAVYVSMFAPKQPHSPLSAYIFYGTTIALGGLYLLRGAPRLVRFCYPASSKSERSGDNFEI